MMRRLKGFTLIEVVLVLAVAGLIMIMVFVGVPALTATQRDSTRKDHMMLFISRLKSFQANNNRGALPSSSGGAQTQTDEFIDGDSIQFEDNNGSTWSDFYGGYMNESFVDPNGVRYNLLVLKCNAANTGDSCTNDALSNPEFYTIYVIKNATCNGIDAIYSANPRSVAVLYKMERSDRYCANT